MRRATGLNFAKFTIASIVCFASLMGLADGEQQGVSVGEKGEIRVNGKPFFPIFSWSQPKSLNKFNKELGINAIVPGETMANEGPREKLLDDLASNGMMAMINVNEYSDEISRHPALLCWMHGDEPDMTHPGNYKMKTVKGAVVIEGETAESSTLPKDDPWLNKPSPILSNGRWLGISSKEKPENPFTLSYAVTVPEDGHYYLYVREYSKTWASPASWRFDGGKWEENKRTLRPASPIQNLGSGKGVGWVRWGEVELKKGAHRLDIRVSEGRTCGSPDKVDKAVLAAFDLFVLSPEDKSPENENVAPVPRHTPEELMSSYKSIRNKDTSHPVWINLTPSFFGRYNKGNLDRGIYRNYGLACDIIGYDHYPVTGWNKPENIFELYDATLDLVKLFPGKVHWVIVENAAQNLSWTPKGTRGPTPEETRGMVWMAIIAGAKGIGYFPVAFNPFRWNNLTEEMKSEMKKINSEITALAPILLEGDLVSLNSSKDIAIRVLKHNRKTYVLAVNKTSRFIESAEIKIDGITGYAEKWKTGNDVGKALKAESGDISINVVDGSFKDEFLPYANKVYVINNENK